MRIICSVAAVISVVPLSGCGWKMMESPLRVTGQVGAAESGEPIKEAYIDISDDKEKLDFAIVTQVLTDAEGRFDTLYRHSYEKWMWLGLPVYWYPTMPERLYIEAAKEGYRSRVVDVDCSSLATGGGKEPPSIRLDPIRLRSRLSSGRSSRRAKGGEE